MLGGQWHSEVGYEVVIHLIESFLNQEVFKGATVTKLLVQLQVEVFFARVRTPCVRCAQVIMGRMETLHIGKGSRTNENQHNQQQQNQTNTPKTSPKGDPLTNVGRVSHCLYQGEMGET